MTNTIIAGAEPWSHEGSRPDGVLAIHGFTGNPASMRMVAEGFAAAGYHVELPLLRGHGTIVDDMMDTTWADWSADAEAAYQALAARVDRVVVAGLSMGGALALQLGADHPGIAALVCINPATQPQPPDVVKLLTDMVEGGDELLPGIGSDIADPDATETAYPGTPLRALLSLITDGLEPLARRYPAMGIPLLLLNSPQDHVVAPEQADFLATTYGGPVQRILLERSYHVATRDYDKHLIVEAAVAFADRVVAAGSSTATS